MGMMGDSVTLEAIVDGDPVIRSSVSGDFTFFRVWRKDAKGVLRMGVTAYDKLGELAYRNLRDRDIIVVRGELRLSEYVDRKGGKQTQWGLKADSIGLSLITLDQMMGDDDSGKKPGKQETLTVSPSKGDMDTVELDVEAEWMRNRGYSPEKVLAFHRAAPEGYWREVESWVADEDFEDIRDIYDSLESTWKWHPDDRNME